MENHEHHQGNDQEKKQMNEHKDHLAEKTKHGHNEATDHSGHGGYPSYFFLHQIS